MQAGKLDHVFGVGEASALNSVEVQIVSEKIATGKSELEKQLNLNNKKNRKFQEKLESKV
jgi:hypothetical protein